LGLFNALQIFIIMKTKICIKCKCEKQLFEFPKRKDSIDGRRNECKVCRKPVKSNKKYDYGKDYFKQHSKKYREANPVKAKKIAKSYRDNNKEKEKARVNRFRIKNKELIAWRRLLTRTLYVLNHEKKNGKTIELLGYSAIQLKIHLESLFTEGMSWDNYGEWHIDHKKPVSRFDKDTPMSVVNCLCNLQPLWAFDNISKGNKLNF